MEMHEYNDDTAQSITRHQRRCQKLGEAGVPENKIRLKETRYTLWGGGGGKDSISCSVQNGKVLVVV